MSNHYGFEQYFDALRMLKSDMPAFLKQF